MAFSVSRFRSMLPRCTALLRAVLLLERSSLQVAGITLPSRVIANSRHSMWTELWWENPRSSGMSPKPNKVISRWYRLDHPRLGRTDRRTDNLQDIALSPNDVAALANNPRLVSNLVGGSLEWTNLFDGKTLTGWSGEPGFWRVENGTIVGQATLGNTRPSRQYLPGLERG